VSPLNTPLSFLLPWILRVILLIILFFHNPVGIQYVIVLLQQSYKTMSFIQQNILSLITLHINFSQLNILLFLLLSLMCMNHGIFRRQIHRMNDGRLCMMSCKPLIKIKLEVLSNFLKISMLWVVVGCIKSSLTRMSLLTNTSHVLWLRAILKLLA
jgi:hypothetical protein